MSNQIVSPDADCREGRGDDHVPPVRIAFCITDLDVGGAERMFVELVTRLNRDHWEPRVYCLSKTGRLADRLTEANISVTCFGAQSWTDLGVVFRLASELRRFRPQLLQCFLLHANLIGRFAAWLARVPRVVCGIRVAERRSVWRLWVDRLTQWLVDHNVCVSQGVAEFSIRTAGLHPNKVSVIPNAVDFERFASARPVSRESLGLSPKSRLILFVGRLDPQKSPRLLLTVFERLSSQHSGWQLLFVGDGPLRGELEQFVTDQHLEGSVRFAGWRPDVPELLKTADCLVLPSLWEGMPNIVLEAMAAGLPVVVSRVEGTDELIKFDETGLLVEPGSDLELEEAIERLLTDNDLAEKLGQAAQQLVKSCFTFDRMVASYEQIFTRLSAPLVY